MMDMYVKFMSVGPVGPRGGIYSIIEDVVCKVYLQKTDLEPNNSGYMQFCLCLWALSGDCHKSNGSSYIMDELDVPQPTYMATSDPNLSKLSSYLTSSS